MATTLTTAEYQVQEVVVPAPEQQEKPQPTSPKRRKSTSDVHKAPPAEKEEDEERFCEFCGRSIVHEPKLNRKAASSRRKYCSKECQSRSAQRRANARLNLDTSRRHIAKRLRLSDPLFFN